MSLLHTLRQDALAARKARDAITASLLVTLVSEAEMTGFNDGKRESSDVEVMATIRKFLKNNAETRTVRPNDTVLLREAEILESYLPKQLSEEALIDVIETAARNLGIENIQAKDTGALMKALQQTHAGQYSGADASRIIKALAMRT